MMSSLYIMENSITNIHALRSAYAECEEKDKARFLQEAWNHPNISEFESTISGNLAREIADILNPNKNIPSQWYLTASMHLKQYSKEDFHRAVVQLDVRDGYKKNLDFWNELCGNITWTEEKCQKFLGLLLLCVQLKESDEELTLNEKELFQSLFYQVKRKEIRVRRLIPDGKGGVYQLTENGKLQHVYFDESGEKDNKRSTMISADDEYIISFAYTRRWEFIAVCAQGDLWQHSNGEILAEWKEKNSPKLAMAAAYGSLYLLLTQQGQIISNVSGLENETDVRWVGAGLNSVSWITGDEYTLHSSIESCENACLTNVCAAWTQESDAPSEMQWIALQQDSTLTYIIEESRCWASDIFAADIARNYFIMADEDGVFLKKEIGGKEFYKILTSQNSHIVELCHEPVTNDERLYLLDETGYLQRVEFSL